MDTTPQRKGKERNRKDAGITGAHTLHPSLCKPLTRRNPSISPPGSAFISRRIPFSDPRPQSRASGCFKAQSSDLSLNLADDLARFGEGFDHLETFFPSADGEVAFFEELFEFVGAVHLLQQLTLHFVFCESVMFELAVSECECECACYVDGWMDWRMGNGGRDALYESEHDGFGHHVDQGSPCDVEIRTDEEL